MNGHSDRYLISDIWPDGSTYLVVLDRDPRQDGYKGYVQEIRHFESDPEFGGTKRYKGKLGSHPNDPHHVHLFIDKVRLQAAGFTSIPGNWFGAGLDWATYLTFRRSH